MAARLLSARAEAARHPFLFMGAIMRRIVLHLFVLALLAAQLTCWLYASIN
jgi:hypothetical protein